MVLLGGDAGLRRGEMIGLNQTDLDFKRRLVHVRRHVYRGKDGLPKNGKPREVHDPFERAVRSYLQAQTEEDARKLLTVMYTGRDKMHGGSADPIPPLHRHLAGVARNKDVAIIIMMQKGPLAEYLANGIPEVKAQLIDIEAPWDVFKTPEAPISSR